jgi:hypothetical protein
MRYSFLLPVLAAGLTAAAPVEQRDVAMDFNPPPGVRASGCSGVHAWRKLVIGLLYIRKRRLLVSLPSLVSVTISLCPSYLLHPHTLTP